MNHMIGFIGVGNMGSALAGAVSRAVSPSNVLLYDAHTETMQSVAKRLRALPAEDLCSLVDKSDVIFLGVKPQGMASLFQELSPLLAGKTEKPLLISMAAGVPLLRLASLAGYSRIIRIMPNTPVSVGEGMIQYAAGADVSQSDKNLFVTILDKAGLLDELPEEKIDAACALSGSGPAFAAVFTEALADAGVTVGLTRSQALLYAAQMLRGTATLILEGEHPAVLKDKVTSPAGTTAAGLAALESGAFRAAAEAAVSAAYRRALEMKKNS